MKVNDKTESRSDNSGGLIDRKIENQILKTLDRVSLGKPPDNKKGGGKNET